MEWTRTPSPLSLPGQPYVDPEADWLLRTVPTHSRERPFGALLRLADGLTARGFMEAGQSGAFGIEPSHWHQMISISPKWADDKQGGGTILTADIGADFIALVNHDVLLQSAIASIALCHTPGLPRGAHADHTHEPLATYAWGEDKRVIVAVIDDSIALGHARFRRGDGGSRIVSAWLQDCEPRQQGHWSGFGYGTHLDNAFHGDIDGLMALGDDDRIAKATGQTDFSRPDRNRLAHLRSHGTHVLDLAVGGSDCPIIAVQLPEATSRDHSGGNLARHVIDAIAFILDEADRFARCQWGQPVPVVINLSYGNHEGPHDGSGALPSAIDRMIERRNAADADSPVCVVVAAGNSANARTHAELTSGADGRCPPVNMTIEPADRTISIIDIFAPQLHAVHIAGPGMATALSMDRHNNKAVLGEDGQLLAVAQFLGASSAQKQDRFRLTVAPSETVNPVSRKVAGQWTITAQTSPSSTVHMWVARDEAGLDGVVGGRQARLRPAASEDSTGAIAFDTVTTNPVASGKHTIAATAMVANPHMRLAGYSASGILDDGTRSPRKALAAFSERSPVASGVLAAASRSAGVMPMNGTSVAAPQVARAIAALWQNDMDSGSTPTPDPAAKLHAMAGQASQLVILPGDAKALAS